MVSKAQKTKPEISNRVYEAELFRLQTELVKLQEWVRASGTRIVVIFEGRDGAGKGGTIKRITEYLNPRFVRIAALPAPAATSSTRSPAPIPLACTSTGPSGDTTSVATVV